MRLWILLLFALTLAAQTPSFEVASIRPSNARMVSGVPICGNSNLNPETVLSQESLLYSNLITLAGLLTYAYNDDADDFDFPQWTQTGVFAVNVKVPPNTTIRTCHKMLQGLLADRFHMVVDMEPREVPRYYLKVAKAGLKLKPAAPATDLDASYSFSIKDGLEVFTFRGAPISRVFIAIKASVLMDARARRFSIAALPATISENSTHGLIDETGLTGYYDGEFKFMATASLHDEFAETLEDALRRQLGLTLELRKGPGKVLVVRSSDRMPTEN